MTPQGRSRRLAALTTAVLAAACVLAPSVAAQSSRPANGNLSPRLAELTKPSVRSAPPDKQAAILDVAPEGPGSLMRDGGRVLITIRFDHGAVAGLDDLRDAGAEIVDASARYQTVTAAVAPVRLKAVASVPRVDAVTESLTPILSGVGDLGPVASTIRLCFGAATSEGDTQLNAMRARDAFSVDGSGVTVGILSDSFARDAAAATSADADVASGDLPGSRNPCGYTSPVDQRLDTYAGADAADEGRAMAQIVHDLAPAARLAFATAFTGSPESFADNIRALAAAGAKVIVDDVIYLEEPFFQEGPVGVAVRDVTDTGVAYFTAAGNNNLIDGGKSIASWEAPNFRDSSPTPCPAGVPAYAAHCMDFDSLGGVDPTFGITVSAGVTLTVDLQWAQPWYGVTTDLDAYLLSGGNVVAPESGGEIHNVASSQTPVEILSWTNNSSSSQTVQLAINRCDRLVCDSIDGGDSGTPPVKFALIQNGGGVTAIDPPAGSTDIFGPTIFGHSGAEDAMSVGAIRYNMISPETFSSRGPVTHYFGPVSGTTPAGRLTPEKVLSKPDIVATDGGANTFFGTCGSISRVWRFFGTSAAAPHAAAVAALELDATDLSATATEVKQAQTATAHDVGSTPDPDWTGAGLLDAYGAINSLVGGTPPGSQSQQPTAQNCPPAPVLPPPTPIETTPIVSTAFSAPPTKKDRIRPETLITKKPAKHSFTQGEAKRVVFWFRSSEKGSSFLCKTDGGRFHQCWRKLVHSFSVGTHVLEVKARDVAGNVDRTPAVYRFSIKRVG